MAYDIESEESKALDQREHVIDVSAKRVVIAYKDGANGDSYAYNPYGGRTERYDYASPPVYYVGSAPVGTLDGEAGWTIQQFDLTDTSDATGKVSTDVSWENRLTGTYV